MFNTCNKYLPLRVKFNTLTINKLSWNYVRCYSENLDEKEIEKEKEIERIKKNASLDDPPSACCRSGCSNCVFIVWAEALASKMEDAGPEITDKIMKTVDDPSMRAYLELELRIRGLKKKC